MSRFPGGKRFAFTIFDDTDHATVENISPVYQFLTELGFRTTKSVWPLPTAFQDTSSGATLADREYMQLIKMLDSDGFEIALHNVRASDSPREVVRDGLKQFASCLGHLPRIHCNHYNNRDNLYWGEDRLSFRAHRLVYRAGTLFRRKGCFQGHVNGSAYFWGDLCQEQITYVRNFVFHEINLDRINPTMPYHNPAMPYVNYWFSSCEGGNVHSFCDTINEANQDRLMEQEGVCIMYAHFASGFCTDGVLNQRFEQLMRRLAAKDGWFVPVATLLDHLRTGRAQHDIPRRELATMERRWLKQKFRRGTS